MLKVKITEKDAKTKKEMANSSRHSFRWIDLDNFQLTKKAGFIHTGAYQDFTLIVFDFDLSSELKGTNYIINNYNWFKKIGETKPYLKVMTPSGGMHLYFIFKEPFEYMNKAKIPTFDPNVVCDIRGKNGIIFSPYTKFEDEKFK
ncbi:MAG: hypothetical protein GYA51_03015, partial [Candidatus Methanofastidiosa archaeon]|nr:hypothetical protein [Candidatus Methanofastidiosa archaeon]